MKWHIENVLAALRSALRLVEALLAAVGAERREQFASLLTPLREAEAQCLALRDASPSNEGPAVSDRKPVAEGLDEEESPIFSGEAPPRP